MAKVKGVMIPALDPDLESEVHLFGNSDLLKSDNFRGVMILDPDPESDFQPLRDSGSGFRSRKKLNRNMINTSSQSSE